VGISPNGTSKQVLLDLWFKGTIWVDGDISLCGESNLEVRLESTPSLFFEVHTRGSVG